MVLTKGFQRLIASGIALLMTLTAMFMATWAILSKEETGLSISVSYAPLVTAKVYISTNSSSAGSLKQPNATVSTENFSVENSALIIDTYSGTASQKTTFEALGAGNGLKCDANGEMEFYVYVENYSTTESVFYRANIDFVGTGGQSAPFSTVTNPSYETAGLSAEPGTPTISLLTFKIKSNNLQGLNANAIRIEIEMFDLILNVTDINGGKYTSGAYSGMYYIEMGTAPQSYAGTTSTISATETVPSKTWIDGGIYYTDTNNQNIQYVLKNDKYYLVEPIRWVIFADENYTGTGGRLGVDYFSNTTIVSQDRTKLAGIASRQIVVVSEKLIANYLFEPYYTNYTTYMTNLRAKIFTASEIALLKTISYSTYITNKYENYNENFSLFRGRQVGENFYASTYLTTPALMKASETAYLSGQTTNPTNPSAYWSRSYYYGSSTVYDAGYITTNGTMGSMSRPYSSLDIRPIFAIDFLVS